MDDKNLTRLKQLLARADRSIGPRPPDLGVMELLARQTQLEHGFRRLVQEVIKPTMDDLGSLVAQSGHGHAITEHSMKSSQISDFVIETQFDWDSAISFHISPHQPTLAIPSPSTPTMAFMMGASHSKIYYKSNYTDSLGRMSDRSAFGLEKLDSERVAALLLGSLEGFLLDPFAKEDRHGLELIVDQVAP